MGNSEEQGNDEERQRRDRRDLLLGRRCFGGTGCQAGLSVFVHFSNFLTRWLPKLCRLQDTARSVMITSRPFCVVGSVRFVGPDVHGWLMLVSFKPVGSLVIISVQCLIERKVLPRSYGFTMILSGALSRRKVRNFN